MDGIGSKRNRRWWQAALPFAEVIGPVRQRGVRMVARVLGAPPCFALPRPRPALPAHSVNAERLSAGKAYQRDAIVEPSRDPLVHELIVEHHHHQQWLVAVGLMPQRPVSRMPAVRLWIP